MLRSSLNFLLIMMVASTLFLALNSDIDTSLAISNENFSSLEVEQINQDDLNYFDVSEFTNTSHIINVSYIIVANQYCYTTTRTEITLYNNASKAINAFNYTIPSHEFKDTKYLEIYSNDTKAEWNKFEEKNGMTVLVVKIPSIETAHSSTIVIQMDHPNAISFEENAKLDETTYPYHFNLSFLPLISLPITSYEIEWKTADNIEVNLKNDSIQPTEDDFTGDFSRDSQGLVFEKITELGTINRFLLNTSEYGDYNLTALENRDFIPAYMPILAINFTYYLSFDFFQQSNTKIEFTKLKSMVTVSEWGYVTTAHEITLCNIGVKSGSLSTSLGDPSGPFPSISFYLPETAKKIGLRDDLGNLTPSVSLVSEQSKKILEISPRVQIEQSAKYNLYLSYRERVSDIVKDLGGGKVQLQIPLSMNFNWTIQQFEFNLLLPHGSSYNLTSITSSIEQKTLRKSTYNSSIRERELLGIFDKTGFKIIFEDLTPLSNQYINIDFRLPLFYFINTPLSICILFLALGIAYTIIRNLSFGLKPKQISLEEIPLDLIKEFVKTYEEKTAIREQILKLDRKRKAKNISAREYEQTRTILRNRQQRIDRSIVAVSRKLSGEGSRYRISMRSIEVAEANREDILLNIESLERKKTQGRIGKEAYAKLKINYDKQLRKANNEIDKVLIDLRSLLTK